MTKKATVAAAISGAGPELSERIEQFTSGLFHTDTVFPILIPRIDMVLASPGLIANKCERFALREKVQAKAAIARRCGARQCIVLTKVAVHPGQQGFAACADLARYEAKVIAEWGFFRELRAACLSPDGTILLL